MDKNTNIVEDFTSLNSYKVDKNIRKDITNVFRKANPPTYSYEMRISNHNLLLHHKSTVILFAFFFC